MVVLIMVLRDWACVASRCGPGVHGQCLRRAPPGGQGLMNRKAPRCGRAPRLTEVTRGGRGPRVPPRHTTRRTSVHRLLCCSAGAVTTATVPASSMNAAPSHDDCQDNVLPSAPPPPEVPKKPSTAPATLPGRPAHSLVRQRGKIPDLGATTAHRRAAAGIHNGGSPAAPPLPLHHSTLGPVT